MDDSLDWLDLLVLIDDMTSEHIDLWDYVFDH
jgi:hypothetical protein